MVIVSQDVTATNFKTFIAGDHFVSTPDGFVAIALDAEGTKFAGQEPFQYGTRNDSTGTPGAYQKWTKQGALLISVIRVPDGRLVAAVYTFVEAPVSA